MATLHLKVEKKEHCSVVADSHLAPYGTWWEHTENKIKAKTINLPLTPHCPKEKTIGLLGAAHGLMGWGELLFLDLFVTNSQPRLMARTYIWEAFMMSFSIASEKWQNEMHEQLKGGAMSRKKELGSPWQTEKWQPQTIIPSNWKVSAKNHNSLQWLCGGERGVGILIIKHSQ